MIQRSKGGVEYLSTIIIFKFFVILGLYQKKKCLNFVLSPVI